MAQLSCLISVKEQMRMPSNLCVKVAAQEAAAVHLNNIRDNDWLYEIEVLEEEHRVKVHYAGYSSQCDEWFRHSDIIFKPPKQLTYEPAVCTGTTGRQMAPKIHQHQC